MPFPHLTKALATVTSPIPVFFRDDDAGWDDVALFTLCDLFTNHAPLDLAVIPTEVDGDLATRLLTHPADLRFHQHGYAHSNHQAGGKKCEFSDDRAAVDIVSDLAAGQDLLQQFFGESLEPIFTPPWNRCGTRLAESLLSQGITVLSRDRGAVPFNLPNVTELPVNVDWTRHVGDLDHALALRSRDPSIGVMLHHATLGSQDLLKLNSLLEFLVAHPNVHLSAMRDVAESRVSS